MDPLPQPEPHQPYGRDFHAGDVSGVFDLCDCEIMERNDP